METKTTHRPIAEIESDLKAAGLRRDRARLIHNEGQGGYVDESEIVRLTAEWQAAKDAASPLATREGIIAEREWARATLSPATHDPRAANKACLERGYSLAELQAAVKTL